MSVPPSQPSEKVVAGQAGAVGLVLAAGRGERLGQEAPASGKAFLTLHGRPLLFWSLRAFEESEALTAVVVVAPPGEEERAKGVAAAAGGKVQAIVAGGAHRQDSLGAGLEAIAELVGADLPGEDHLVAVHDAARPLVRPIDVSRVVYAAERRGAAILAVPVKETVKVVGAKDRIIETPNRERLWLAQTPQVARASILRSALKRARDEGRVSTDEAALLEALEIRVQVVLGDYGNLKVTTPEDVILADCLLAAREAKVREPEE